MGVRRYARTKSPGIAVTWVAAMIVTAAPAAAQSSARDHSSWNPSEIALAGAFAVALWADAAQTRAAMRQGYEEVNPVLGPHPSVGKINTYTAVAGLGVLAAAALAPRRARPWLLGAALAVEMLAVAGNARAGLAVKFP